MASTSVALAPVAFRTDTLAEWMQLSQYPANTPRMRTPVIRVQRRQPIALGVAGALISGAGAGVAGAGVAGVAGVAARGVDQSAGPSERSSSVSAKRASLLHVTHVPPRSRSNGFTGRLHLGQVLNGHPRRR